MKRIGALLLILCLCLGLCTGCESEVHTFSYYIPELPVHLDPQLATEPIELTCVQNLYRGLFRLSAEGEPVLDAASDYTVSEDGLTYTFTLRDDIYWSREWNEGKDAYTNVSKTADGEPLIADDFVFALQRVFLSSTASPYASLLSGIKGSEQVQRNGNASDLAVRAVDTHTLVITLSKADPDFPKKLCSAGAMPCHRGFFLSTKGAYGTPGSKRPADNLMTNGSFYLTVWDTENGVTMRRREPDELQIGRVRLIPLFPVIDRPVDSANQITEQPLPADRLKEGLSNLEVLPVGTTDGSYEEITFTATTWGIAFACDHPYFSNTAIRRSLSSVAASQELSSLSPAFAKAEGLIPPSVTMGGSNYRQKAGNLIRSVEDPRTLYYEGIDQLIDSGVIRPLHEGKKLSNVTMLIPEEEPYYSMAVTISQSWQKDLSAFFSLETMPLAELEKRVEKGDYEIALYPMRAQRNDVPDLLEDFSRQDKGNLFRYSGVSVPAAGASLSECRTAEEQLLAEMPFCPLVTETTCFALSDYKNVQINPFGPVIDFTWAEAAVS